MARQPDPYRTLGLDRGASLTEVKQAYRRLVKANHPDRAGEAALPRFLAIQEAYDLIAGPDSGGRGGGPGSPASPGPARRPWDADPDRAGATHRAYGGRARRTRPNAGPRPRTGASGPGGGAGPGGPAAGGSGSGQDAGPGQDSGPGPGRPPNKATLGSTSYDGAGADPFEPDWAGASWYGTTSGTYWTLNPKEYADPRKHGPEYQARARRNRSGGRAGTPGSIDVDPFEQPPGPEPGVSAGPPPAHDGPPPSADAPSGPRPATHTTASWWGATAGATARSAPGASQGATSGREGTWTAGDDRDRPTAPPDRPARTATAAEPAEVPSAEGSLVAAVRGWLDDERPGPAARVGRAVVGWAPIALGIGWAAGEVSGCGRFSADCDPAVGPGSWVVEIALLALLLVAPRLARIATTATLATLAAVIPGAVLLLATSDPSAVAAGRSALAGLMIIAWAAGLAVGVGRELRSARRAGPVS